VLRFSPYFRLVRKVLLIVCVLCTISVGAQKDPVYRKRQWLFGATNAAVLGSSTLLLNELWYKDYPKSSFHFFNDAGNWRGMDKLGHSFTAYKLSCIEYFAWSWSGVPMKKATWLSGGISWGYLFTVEVLDGFNSEWGFSVADLGANTLGSGLFIAQQLTWKDQRVRMKFSYKPSPYAELRPEVLGANLPERFLKDYNAQSYWLSTSPARYLPDNVYFPGWLQLSVGYSANQMLKGDSDHYTLNNFTYKAQSEFALSLDIDWTQLPIRRVWLKKLLQPLNAIKLPFPAVYWRNGVCYVGMF